MNCNKNQLNSLLLILLIVLFKASENYGQESFKYSTSITINNKENGYSGTLPITYTFANCLNQLVLIFDYNRNDFKPTGYTLDGKFYAINTISHLDPNPDVQCVSFKGKVIEGTSVIYEWSENCTVEGTSCLEGKIIFRGEENATSSYLSKLNSLRFVITQVNNITREDGALSIKIREMESNKNKTNNTTENNGSKNNDGLVQGEINTKSYGGGAIKTSNETNEEKQNASTTIKTSTTSNSTVNSSTNNNSTSYSSYQTQIKNANTYIENQQKSIDEFSKKWDAMASTIGQSLVDAEERRKQAFQEELKRIKEEEVRAEKARQEQREESARKNAIYDSKYKAQQNENANENNFSKIKQFEQFENNTLSVADLSKLKSNEAMGWFYVMSFSKVEVVSLEDSYNEYGNYFYKSKTYYGYSVKLLTPFKLEKSMQGYSLADNFNLFIEQNFDINRKFYGPFVNKLEAENSCDLIIKKANEWLGISIFSFNEKQSIQNIGSVGLWNLEFEREWRNTTNQSSLNNDSTGLKKNSVNTEFDEFFNDKSNETRKDTVNQKEKKQQLNWE